MDVTISDLKRAVAVATGSALATRISVALFIALFALAILVLIGRALRWVAEDGPGCAMKWLDVRDRWKRAAADSPGGADR